VKRRPIADRRLIPLAFQLESQKPRASTCLYGMARQTLPDVDRRLPQQDDRSSLVARSGASFANREAVFIQRTCGQAVAQNLGKSCYNSLFHKVISKE